MIAIVNWDVVKSLDVNQDNEYIGDTVDVPVRILNQLKNKVLHIDEIDDEGDIKVKECPYTMPGECFFLYSRVDRFGNLVDGGSNVCS